jgi:hypothetical protein
LRLSSFALLLALAACSDPAAPRAAPRILYIGNSLTYANDLPAIVAALATAAGEQTPVYTSVAFGGFSLGDHWSEGTAARTLQSGHWDYVVMQQGPSSLDESRAQLISDVERFTPLIRAAGGQPALYSVWPEIERFDVFAQVNTSYQQAAEAVGGLLLPAGEAWQDAWAQDPTLPLYGDDGFHPSVMGSYLAALSIFGRIYNHTPTNLPSHLEINSPGVGVVDIVPGTARILQAAAAQANAEAPPISARQ